MGERSAIGWCDSTVKQDAAWKSEARGRIPDDLWVREFPR
jgi:hypothetical protein